MPDYVGVLIYVDGIEASMPPSANRSNTPQDYTVVHYSINGVGGIAPPNARRLYPPKGERLPLAAEADLILKGGLASILVLRLTLPVVSLRGLTTLTLTPINAPCVNNSALTPRYPTF